MLRRVFVLSKKRAFEKIDGVQGRESGLPDLGAISTIELKRLIQQVTTHTIVKMIIW